MGDKGHQRAQLGGLQKRINKQKLNTSLISPLNSCLEELSYPQSQQTHPNIPIPISEPPSFPSREVWNHIGAVPLCPLSDTPFPNLQRGEAVSISDTSHSQHLSGRTPTKSFYSPQSATKSNNVSSWVHLSRPKTAPPLKMP